MTSSPVRGRTAGDPRVRPYGPDDAAVVAEVTALGCAVSRADSPWEPDQTVAGVTHRLRHGWDGEPPRGFVLYVDGRVRGSGELWVSDYDNLDAAWLGLCVHPDWRRRGLGSLLLEHLLAQARDQGRTNIGMDGWESSRSRGFAGSHGFTAKSVEVQRRQHLAELDWSAIERAHAGAAEHARDYELLHVRGRSPEPMLPALAELVAAINDAPLDDLDLEDERFPVERVRAYESVQVEAGRLYRVLARHRQTGRLAGHTVVHVEHDRPTIAHQHDTSVAAAHRGHRLGLLLKAELLLRLRLEEPQLAYVDTWNARSNARMIAVNESLGYRVVGTAVAFQRRLDPVPAVAGPARTTVDA